MLLPQITTWHINIKYTKEYVNEAHKNFIPGTHPSIWEAKEGL
jgi:hypothetical protein